jgi:hypothetical protein
MASSKAGNAHHQLTATWPPRRPRPGDERTKEPGRLPRFLARFAALSGWFWKNPAIPHQHSPEPETSDGLIVLPLSRVASERARKRVHEIGGGTTDAHQPRIARTQSWAALGKDGAPGGSGGGGSNQRRLRDSESECPFQLFCHVAEEVDQARQKIDWPPF